MVLPVDNLTSTHAIPIVRKRCVPDKVFTMTKSTPSFLPLRFPTGETIDLDPTLEVTVWGRRVCASTLTKIHTH